MVHHDVGYAFLACSITRNIAASNAGRVARQMLDLEEQSVEERDALGCN